MIEGSKALCAENESGFIEFVVPSAELPKRDEGGGPAGVNERPEDGGGPAGVVEGSWS